MSDDLERVTLTPEQREKFLETIAAQPGTGHVRLLRELGVTGRRGQLRELINTELRADIDGVRNDAIRQELARRGIEGWDEPVYWQGQIVGHIRRYSDRALIALAQMRLPEARNQLDVNLAGADGGPVRVEVEGDRVSTVSGVLALAAQLGVQGAAAGLDAGAARRALPAAESVLSDPPVDQ